MMKYNFILFVALAFVGFATPGFASEGEALVAAQCAQCHELENPHYETLPLSERIDRKAPPLYYAGNKFNRSWLAAWLQNPVRIRPAGYFPVSHAIDGPDGDVVDQDSLKPHPALSAADARLAADYLMSLAPYNDRIEAVTYEPGSISWKMGNLNFGKFNGCDACHKDAPDFGGLTGPELYTVWQRLQPKFIASFITDPVAWDPHTLMPHKAISPAVVTKLTNYLKVNGEEPQ